MMESRGSYSPGEMYSPAPYKWCVKLVIGRVDRGIVGMESKAAAEKWLANTLRDIESGRCWQGASVAEAEAEVYYAKKRMAVA